MIKISVIVPIYNMEKYLKRCLDSLLNQTLKDIEIIAIDDGSTDNSYNILKEYENNSKLKFYHNKNQGISKTRNFGIEKAKGEYVAFIDSDDYVDVNMFENMYKKAKKDDLDVVVCDYMEFDENSNKKIVNLSSFSNKRIKDDLKLLFDINSSPWNKIFRRSLILSNNYRFPENVKYEDLGYIPILLYEANKVGKINMNLNYYFVRSNSETTTIDSRVYDIFKIFDILFSYFLEKNIIDSKELEYLYINKLTQYNLQQKYSKNKKEGLKFVNKSFNYLNVHFPNWKNNIYFKKDKIKYLIKSSKLLTKLYISIGGKHEY